ncbi:NAD(P)H-dependent oxidoreductase [Paenibacillus sp. TRM 82003]|nr:NAD(P)H-dependent oxidoreductase [Paenibacillus sp. TRM 82003]
MNITIIAGSNRKDASSTKLLRYMETKLQRRHFTVTFVDLYADPVPLYAPDDEGAPDANVARLLRAVREADGLVIGTPEYHGSISGALKNALDYLGSSLVSGKPALSVSSAGGAAGVASLTQLQAILRNLHAVNSPEWVSLGGHQQRFDADGVPAEESVRARVERAVDVFASLIVGLRQTAVAGKGE